ncbi:MAG: hypothetical protein HN390_14970 [Anaerolineae bacterium]|jgi:predicted CXXCH cytochrome family protein|nr:hypothetical protein [Anaerolineae bacterium]MBT7190970.1 hypothetical protein [Anaerolineae bacterium]MBT7989920.1 hypothetical protein [Anaerolineae bacterium]
MMLQRYTLFSPFAATMIAMTLFCVSCASSVDAEVEIAAPETPTAMASPCFDSGCHIETLIEEAEYKHRPYADQQCLECHEKYHDEETQHDYLEHDIQLCISCHPDGVLGNTHPVGEGTIDPNTQQMMTCTSTCHMKHTAPYPYLLALPASGQLCVSCHQDLLE